MLNIYKKINKKQFIYTSVLLMILSDIDLIFYIYSLYGKEKNFSNIFLKMGEYSSQFNDLPPQFFLEVFQLWSKVLISSLAIFVTYHFFIYIFYIKEKMFSIKYIRFYTMMGAIGSFISGIMEFNTHTLFAISFMLLCPGFFFVYSGIDHFLLKNRN